MNTTNYFVFRKFYKNIYENKHYNFLNIENLIQYIVILYRCDVYIKT